MNRTRTVLALGAAQTLAWASSYYLPAMLAAPMARDLGVTRPVVFAVFSAALLVAAFIGPLAGRLIDRHGGRTVLVASNLLFVPGLAALALAQGLATLIAAWLLLGLAMGMGLYGAAFAALVRLYGKDARHAITGITLMAGFASTVGWPLTTLLEAQLGWRGACWVWAGLHVLLGLPLNAALPRLNAPAAPSATPATAGDAPGAMSPATGDTPAPSPPAAPGSPARWTAAVLAVLFAMLGFVSTAMAAHLPALLQACGATLAVAVLAGSLVGPAQVAARLFEFSVLRRLAPMASARIAALAHPVGAVLLLAAGPVAALPFALLHGAGNGLLTIVRGTLPLALFGAAGYGGRQGWIALPGSVLGALSPWLFGVALERFGARALWVSGGMCLGAWCCLLSLRQPGPR